VPAPQRLAFLVPGSPAARTGGTRYDVSLADALEAAGVACSVHGLDGAWPGPDDVGARALGDALSGLADGTVAIVDGLCLATLAGFDTAPRFIALMHHPAALETGLSPDEAARLRALETRALARAARVVATSGYTARLLAEDYGVMPERIGVVSPGVSVTPVPLRQRPSDPAVRVLAVASVTPRKGYEVLVDAATLLRRDRPDLPAFRIDCYGSTGRDPVLVRSLRSRIVASGLADTVCLCGEADDAALAAAYGAADLFVHTAHFEGYGMAVADALAAGVPVVAAAGGAVGELVPETAGMLVAPGDATALAAALADAIGDPGRRAVLAEGARIAGKQLPCWSAAARRFLDECRKADR
jgi:glycosyltransferase involved in cell wall biosynthesis